MLRSIYLLSFFLLQSLFAFAGNVKESVPSTFDLYVCIGQSNMAACNINSGSHGYPPKCVSIE